MRNRGDVRRVIRREIPGGILLLMAARRVRVVAVVNIITGRPKENSKLRLYYEVGVFDVDLVFLEAFQAQRARSRKQP